MTTPGDDPAPPDGRNALALHAGQRGWTPQQRAALGVLGIRGATDADLQVFLHVCQVTGLDPFSRQIYMIRRREKTPDGQWADKWTIQTGIDGWRVIRDRVAERRRITVEYEDTTWFDNDGTPHTVWLYDEPPAACRFVTVAGGKRFPSVLRFAEYCQYIRTPDGKTRPAGQWVTRPAHMIEKCAEADSLRRAFPHDYAGMRLEEEMPPAGDDGSGPPGRPRVSAAELRRPVPPAVIPARPEPEPEPEPPPPPPPPKKAARKKPDPAPPDDPGPGPRPITRDQLAALNAKLRVIGVTAKRDAHALVTSRINRDITTAADMTEDEANTVLDWLEEKAAEIAAQHEPDDELEEAADADDR